MNIRVCYGNRAKTRLCRLGAQQEPAELLFEGDREVVKALRDIFADGIGVARGSRDEMNECARNMLIGAADVLVRRIGVNQG